MPIILQNGNIVCGTEVSFLDRDEANYPQLMRLHLDFDFRVLSLSNPAHGGDQVQGNPLPALLNTAAANEPALKSSEQSARYLVTFNTHRDKDVPTITPVFSSLPELESYANDNIVDILNKLVVDAPED